MRHLVYYVAVTIDGFIAGPDGDYSMFDSEGDHMATLFRDFADAIPGVGLAALGLHADRSRFYTVLMGWNTYAVGLPLDMTDPYPHLDTVVFSRSHAGDDIDPAITVTDADPVSVVQQLKERGGSDIWLCGGGQLATALQNEIDALVLKVNPIVLGAGIPLFAPPPPGSAGRTAAAWPVRFVPTATTTYASGVTISHYDRRR